MDLLHAYWRMEYVSAPKKDGEGHENPFKRLPESGDDRKALILIRSQYTYALLNRYPYNPGHLLVVPYREVPDLADLSVDERADLMELIVRCKETLAKAMKPDGFNIGFNLGGASGAGIPQHLHGHIVPRWNGDTNFMPVIGQARVLPEALDRTWEKLKEHC